MSERQPVGAGGVTPHGGGTGHDESPGFLDKPENVRRLLMVFLRALRGARGPGSRGSPASRAPLGAPLLLLSALRFRRHRRPGDLGQGAQEDRHATGGLLRCWLSSPPFLVFFAGALLVALSRGRVRQAVLLLVPVLAGVQLLALEDGTRWTMELMGYELVPLRVDRLSLLFGYLFAIATFLGKSLRAPPRRGRPAGAPAHRGHPVCGERARGGLRG